jgi:Sec-independent protein translocase protein TatA
MEFNIVETIKSLQSLIITVLIILALLFFRKELKKLVDWIVSFKNISKTKNGYQASAGLESSGLSPETEELSSKAIQNMQLTEIKRKKKNRHGWKLLLIKGSSKN